ncbi:kinase-like protein [Rhizophagus irregularis]|uniref:Kinase-like protein n=1 Tax=Rhizophagus irregularis TaxID=588596 RepID=A0A2N1MH21_9GLOM|nr:kinase-like protein [Rhizophagus irregularis]
MSTIRRELVHQEISKAWSLLDLNIYEGLHNQYKFIKQTILADSSLTDDEKTEAIRITNKDYDRDKVRLNEGIRRICENCNKKCLATLYCEYCVQDYLKARFPNWTSGNNDIDNLIQKCQSEMLTPDRIVEWIPYNNLMNIKYLTKGGFSKIYTADWINGPYKEWDSKKQQLERIKVPGIQNFVEYVILKELENIEGASQSWLEEAKSHLNISSKHPRIVACYGLTKNPSNGNYMLVIRRESVNLREYLLQNHNQLTWKERIKIAFLIIDALRWIHKENSIHRDLHSGNILYSQLNDFWYISDLGFCGPKIYFASDIYSIAMLMWEIPSGRPPFNNHENDYYLAMNIVNGIRPRIVSGTPLEYKNLMKQCWDADPLKRPDIDTLLNKISGINALYQNITNELDADNNLETNDSETNYTSSRLFNTSKIHQFENFPEPRNATEEEQEAFHSKSYKFSIPQNNIFKEDAIKQQIKRQDRDVNDMQIEEFASEQSVSQTEQITIIDNKNEGKGKSKRIYSEDEKEDLTDDNKSKKIKLNSNKANFQYIQRNYIADDDEFDIPEDGFE